MTPSNPQLSTNRIFDADAAAAKAGLLLRNLPMTLKRAPKTEQELVEACLVFADAFQKWESLLAQRSSFDPQKMEQFQHQLIDLQKRQMLLISNLEATTLHGHSARAAVALMLDQGAVIEQANSGGPISQRILAALLVDLVNIPVGSFVGSAKGVS